MSLWDFLFPPVCPHCGAPVATQGDWCKACFTDLLHIRHVPHTVSYTHLTLPTILRV